MIPFYQQIEETNNELDLRLHLHEPRPSRAEKDVHDVRLGVFWIKKSRRYFLFMCSYFFLIPLLVRHVFLRQ